ncbi:siderophore ABC transporter substrate-binding protein [Arthrobacter sp. zg-Y20]|uniref:siderophore ABC transporter substrate-binding protein n=1 Tax=unclassified Arthrobacter TaxID=235627 RepID=UPI001D13A2BD|nr:MULTISPECIES: siderophore ABC transporter substrate-binding protein [unclassified Arthrobacter]MCC3276143.1 siderophore ABC transporter substrate-binding protein [Arthrobacter sp. zg-Y20]MDK1316303.1 siderophore ABC transporter substrate-binding protein [Arthrobacter sp. zg.Y20]WIB05419.1 siderophore ABC transporter substrate-binding protein [Arthrobacter sp. zg-Y20]
MITTSRLLAGTALVSLLALSACSTEAAEADAESTQASTVTVEHAQGSTEVPVNPETVYTFDLGALDTMDALDIDVDGVPAANFPESLSKYAADDITKIGSMKEPDFEAISAEAPDLIIISGRVADSYEELNKIAPTIDLSVDNTDAWNSFEENTRTIGKIFGKDDMVEDKLSALESKVGDTKKLSADAGNGLIVMTSGGEMTAYGAGSRFGIIHDVLGVEPAAEVKTEGAHGESVSFNYIADTNPDHLFVIDRDVAVGESGEAASAVLDNELVKSTKAAQNNNITMLDSASWYLVGYGLNNVDSMVSTIHDAL